MDVSTSSNPLAGTAANQSAQALYAQGIAAWGKGDYAAALRLATQAAQLCPREPVYFNLLGASYYHLGKLAEAVAAYRQAIAVHPSFAGAYSNLSLVLADLDQLEEAEKVARQSVQLNPAAQETHCNLGIIFMRQGKVEEAQTAFLEVMKLPHENLDAMRNVANSYNEMGQFANAQGAYLAILRRNPRDGQCYERLSQMRCHTVTDLASCAALEAILMDRALPAHNRVGLHFALGKMYEDMGHYDQSFTHYRQGNETSRVPFDRRTHEQFVDKLIEYFTPERFASRRGQGSNSEQPIFVVGMFRSGTSLVEQVLASHPRICGAGELMDIPAILTELFDNPTKRPFPASLEALQAADLLRLAEAYLERRARDCGAALRIIDKMPKNFLGLGLIAFLFPRARVIHCRRDPRDIAISCYSKNFTETSSYTSNLADIGFYYRQYARLMNHWHAVLPLPIFDVQYEEFIGDQSSMTRRLLEFCNVPWDDHCLNFHQTERRVATASHWQVRQPLYSTSVGRWRKFENQLGSLVDELGGSEAPAGIQP